MSTHRSPLGVDMKTNYCWPSVVSLAAVSSNRKVISEVKWWFCSVFIRPTPLTNLIVQAPFPPSRLFSRPEYVCQVPQCVPFTLCPNGLLWHLQMTEKCLVSLWAVCVSVCVICDHYGTCQAKSKCSRTINTARLQRRVCINVQHSRGMALI